MTFWLKGINTCFHNVMRPKCFTLQGLIPTALALGFTAWTFCTSFIAWPAARHQEKKGVEPTKTHGESYFRECLLYIEPGRSWSING